MSVVTGVVLSTSCTEEDGPNLPAINAWLDQRGFRPLVQVEDGFGGTKHPQLMVAGAGFNYFDDAEFAAFVMDLEWDMPEQVVLVLTREQDAAQVFRPKGY